VTLIRQPLTLKSRASTSHQSAFPRSRRCSDRPLSSPPVTRPHDGPRLGHARHHHHHSAQQHSSYVALLSSALLLRTHVKRSGYARKGTPTPTTILSSTPPARVDKPLSESWRSACRLSAILWLAPLSADRAPRGCVWRRFHIVWVRAALCRPLFMPGTQSVG
jgi:hypothetical protein